ncbi:MAG: hypothetical protein ACREON_05835 [Gemmatimonadaceae bacterium]
MRSGFTGYVGGRALKRLALALAACAALARPSAAQIDIVVEGLDDGEQAAYFAITSTPLGALPSLVPFQLGGVARRTGLRAHYGYIDEEGSLARRTLGAGLDIAVGPGTIGLTAGYHDIACDEDELEEELGLGGLDIGCGGGFIIGGNFAAPLVQSPLNAAGSTTFVLGVDAALGYGTGSLFELSLSDPGDPLSFEVDASSLSGGLGIPLLVVARTGGVTLVPHLTPRFAYGRVTLSVDTNVPGADADDESEDGTRFMLGGGLGILFDGSGFGLDLGFQKVFVEDGKTMLGLGVRYVMR